MGSINIDNTGSGADVSISSDGTDLLLDGTAIGGGGGADLFAENYDGTSTLPSATGTNAVAMGVNSQSKDSHTISIGHNTIAGTGSGSDYAVAIGYHSDATGYLAMAIGGNSPQATGTSAVAIGGSTIASGSGSVAIHEAYSSGTDSLAMNITTNSSSYGATGNKSIAMGDSSKATGSYALAIGGPYATATGISAIAIGRGAATANGAISIGPYASYGQPWASAATSISIGDGSSSAAADGVALGSRATVASGGDRAVALGYSRASGSDSLAAAIANNTSSYGATGANSIALGQQAKASQTNALAINGTASGVRSIAIGDASSATATSATAIGYSTTAVGSALAIGVDANAQHGYSAAILRGKSEQQGKMAFSGMFFGTKGDAQGSTFVLLADTTDATATRLTGNNLSASTNNQIILPNNSAYAFHGTIVARQQASGGTASAAWKVEGLIRREGSAGTTVLVNSATTVLDNTPSWGMALSADTTNGGLAITVTGAASTNIRWVATIHTSEVTYA